MADVFISYSRRDIGFVRKLYGTFASYNRKAWVDWTDILPTAEWLKEIFSGIEGADAFVCVLSPDFTASPVCGQEVAHAISCKKHLVPIVYRDVDRTKVDPALASLNWIFFRDNDDFDDAFKKLIDALDTDFNYIHMHTRLLVRAHEWESKGRNTSFTLRGKELTEAEHWLAEGTNKKPELTLLHKEYITASRRSEKIRRRSLWSIAGVASIVLVVALVVSLILQSLLQRSLPASVTTLNDDGPGSLRQAIASATPRSVITFANGLRGTIILTQGYLHITKNLVIDGSGISIDGGNNDVVFSVDNDVTVTLSNLTIENGKHGGISNNGTLILTNSTVSNNKSDGHGGGISNSGTLTIRNSTIFNNMSVGNGGGIYNDANGIFTLTNSTVSDNMSRRDGGGIYNNGSGFIYNSQGVSKSGELAASIINSTISKNTSQGNGGGIYDNSHVTLTLQNSTVSSNVSKGDGGGISHNKSNTLTLFQDTISGNTATDGNGGGISIRGSQTDILYCTIYGNSAMLGGGGGMIVYDDSQILVLMGTSIVAGDHANIGPDILGTLTLHNHNLIQNISGSTFSGYLLVAKITITGIPPDVGPLQNNGGSTQTHALLAGSPAIDQEPCESANSFPDQRGILRPQGSACDLGAYEYMNH